jgi:hypothetical protein
VTIDVERATERKILSLELTIDARDETIRELRTRVYTLEEHQRAMTRDLLEALNKRPVSMATPVSVAPAAAERPAGAISVGPKAQRAISRVAGRNRALGQQLMEAAMDELAANPDITDDELAGKIFDGESPDSDSDDEDVEVARGRVIPGGAE